MVTTNTRPPEIPGYQLLELLGEGGMGAVYRAVQLSLQRPVAIKVLAPYSEGGHQVLDLERESRVMAQLSHPNVVVIYDSGNVAGRPYLVMEFICGPSLRPMLQDGRPWPVARALPLLDQIARALSYIHSQGILHLDLKPENVLLQRRDNRRPESELCSSQPPVPGCSATDFELGPPDSFISKITDFGLALPTVAIAGMAEPTLAQGTVDYCPPELRHGLPIDARTDLFSLATLAYEVLTGRLPGRVFLAASQRNRQLPAAADLVLQRGLARDREERYDSVEEFRADLLAVFGSCLAEAELTKRGQDLAS